MSLPNGTSQETIHILLLTTGVSAGKAFLPFLINLILSSIYKETSIELSLRRREWEINTALGSLSIVDEFAKYAKLQRQLNKVKEDLIEANSKRLACFMKIRLTANYAVQLIFAVVILITIWFYKSTPTVVLPPLWISPFGSILSWPTDVNGAISISMWLLMLESSFRVLSSKLFHVNNWKI